MQAQQFVFFQTEIKLNLKRLTTVETEKTNPAIKKKHSTGKVAEVKVQYKCDCLTCFDQVGVVVSGRVDLQMRSGVYYLATHLAIIYTMYAHVMFAYFMLHVLYILVEF